MKRLFLLLITTILFTHCVISQVFEEQTDILIQGIKRGSVAWGDYNNDGLLDFGLTGNSGGDGFNYYSAIFLNIENNTYSENSNMIQAVEWSSLEWGDYNNDNYLDIVLSGINYYFTSSIDYTCIYKNNYNDTLELQYFPNISSTSEGDVYFGDYNNDAYLDILQTGKDSYSNIFSKIYNNNKNNSFSEQTQIYIEGRWCGSIVWFDYNNDSFLDFILTGSDGTFQHTNLYENDGNNNFYKQNQIDFIDVMDGNIDVSDYNNDGYLDIIICGIRLNKSEILTGLYRNNGDKTFTNISFNNISKLCFGSVRWGDYNNDGYSDFLINGYDIDQKQSKIYKNNYNDTFIEQTDETIIPVGYSDAAWGDYNNDSKLDILITGLYASSSVTSKIYKNNTPVANIRPNVITNLQTEIIGNDVYFSWDEATDPNQPSAGLNYNIYVYDEANRDHIISGDTIFDGLYIASPQAFPYYHELNGKRLMPKRGYIQGIRENGRVTYFLKGVFENCKTYYWSVQAIDASFEGGEFAPEQSFFFETSPVPDSEHLPLLTATCSLTVTTIPTATDVCMGTIIATTTDPLEYDEDGFYTITWNYLGGNGNVVSQIQHVNINDNIPVTLDNENLPVLYGECSVSVTEIPAGTDNCSGIITATTTDPLEYTEQGSYTITWRYDDGNGNVTTQNQQVVVEDDIPPSIICPEDKTINLQQGQTFYTVTGTELDPETTEDNCEIVSITNNYNNTSTLDCNEIPIGTTTIIWTATDIGGNTADCSLNIQVNEFVGISNSFETAIKIYPNPTSSILNIEGLENDSKIEITDVTGKIISTANATQSTIKIDLSDIVSGIYILKIYSTSEFTSIKIEKY